MIFIKANCHYRYPGHNAKQSRNSIANERYDTWLKNPSAVLACPNNVVARTNILCSVLVTSMKTISRLKAHLSTAKAVVSCR